MKRHLVVGLMALLPLLAAMPCLCSTDAPKKTPSCCCHDEDEKPLGKTQCCCTIKDKPEYTVETPSLPAGVEMELPIVESIEPRATEMSKEVPPVDTGPPVQTRHSVLRL